MGFGATSYSWAGAGRRDWLIQVSTTCNITNGPITNLVNGRKANNNDSGVFCNSAESGREFKFVYPWAVLMDEFTWTQDSAGTQGTWKLEGSNDDTTYADIVTGLNIGGASAVDVHSFTNTTPYRYYRLTQTAGSTTNSRWIQEVEFKVALDSALGGTIVGTTSYSNTDGSGNRSARMLMLLNVDTACGGSDVGNMNAMLNGVTGVAGCTDATAFHNGETTDEIKICFRNPTVVDEFTWKQALVAAHGTWKIAGSTDDITYTDLGTGIALGAGSTTEAFSFSNINGYFFYKLIQTAGSTNSSSWLYEIEFKTAASAPSPHYVVAAVGVEVLNNGDGANADVAATAVEVLSTGDGSTALVAAVGVEVLMSTSTLPHRAFDGGKIYEFTFAFQPETLYSESDWDSVYSIGDRAGNGLMQMNSDFPGANFGLSPQNMMDYRADTHFVVEGGHVTGASLSWKTLDGSYQFISGIRLSTGSVRSLGGYWMHLAGFDGRVWVKNTIEFDEFAIGYTAPSDFDSAQFRMDFTPLFFPWNFWTITLTHYKDSDEGSLATTEFGSELMLKVYHSVLDGGDRRPTNGRSIKRVEITASSGILAVSGTTGVDPFLNIIDGVYASTGKASHTYFTRVGGSPGDDEITAPGEYIQFKFPRKVVMRDTVWNIGVSYDGGEVLDSGGNPLYFGKWQWQASNAANSGYINIGDPWHFIPGSIWMRSPMPILALRQDAAEPADYNLYLYPYWRMVLVEGPAFGGSASANIYQLQFNLIDPDNQFPLLEAAFTDDADGALPTPTIGPPGNPLVNQFTDGTDDKMTATPVIVPNLSLTVAFSDGPEDGITTYGSMYPTVYSQTLVIAKGR
jgi:hypothetical protein